MRRFWEYTLFFIILTLLQALLFDNLNLSIYVTPLVYVAFLVLLPATIGRLWLLLLGLLTGVALDAAMGTNGLNTIASLATAFIRPGVMNLVFGLDVVRECKTPLPRELGTARWVQYAAILVAVHCLLFFFFEAMGFTYLGFTLLRVLCSAGATLLLVWFIGAIYPAHR